MTRAFLFAPAFAAALACMPAQADTFDGNWQVTIVTKQGTCNKAYSYALSVQNGTIAYAGKSNFDIQGKVQNNGAVNVRIALGERSASGTGRLSGKNGSGTWADGKNSCSGTWKASRKA
jgi:hypothetical protein